LIETSFSEVVLQPTPALTFRTLGGVLDLYFMLGPDPIDVVEQYTEVVGRPFLVPYWSLGYHQCRCVILAFRQLNFLLPVKNANTRNLN
jgi:lysosomal alpha-glucosidase